jgi:hypothetical protein
VSPLLRAADLQLDVVVGQVVQPLAVVLEVAQEPLELAHHPVDVGVLQHLGGEGVQPAQQRVPLTQGPAGPRGEPGVPAVGPRPAEPRAAPDRSVLHKSEPTRHKRLG